MKDTNEYLRNDKGVHIGHPEMDTTICGDAIEGDTDMAACETVPRQRITCRICLAMMKAFRVASAPNAAGELQPPPNNPK